MSWTRNFGNLTLSRPDYPGYDRSSEEWDVNDKGSETQRSGKAKKI